MEPFITTDWQNFFSIEIGAAVALAGLLIVSMTISIKEADLFEKRMGTSYYLETIAPIIISLTAILSPRLWWIGPFLASSIQLIYLRRVLPLLKEYRTHWAKAYKDKDEDSFHWMLEHALKLLRGEEIKEVAPNPTLPGDDTDLRKANIYKAYKVHFKLRLFASVAPILVAFSGLMGIFVFSDASIHWTQYRFAIPPELPISIAGVISAWYLVSASLGTAYILFKRSSAASNVQAELGFSLPQTKQLCKGKTKTGAACKHSVISGTEYCYNHQPKSSS